MAADIAQSTTAQPDTAQPNLFVKNLVFHLRPYFQAYGAPSEAELQDEALATLHNSGATTRLGLLNAALAVAFGYSALETMTQAKQDTSLPPALRLRYRVCANALYRSCRQTQAALAGRRSCDATSAKKPAKSSRPDTEAPRPDAKTPEQAATTPQPDAKTPQPEAQAPQPHTELTDAEAVELIRQAQAQNAAHKAYLTAAAARGKHHREDPPDDLLLEVAAAPGLMPPGFTPPGSNPAQASHRSSSSAR